MTESRLLVGKSHEILPTLEAESFDAIVTDPPYEINFMNKGWDRSGIAFNVEIWRECWRVLKPGGYLLAFGGTRTFHRMTVAIEDAGFEIRDCLSWLHGEGFPKSRNLRGDWDGWGTALKPAWEPVIMARKPLGAKTVAANVLEYGTGAINIDGCRISTDAKLVRPYVQRFDNEVYGKGLGAGAQEEPCGRWPANVLLDETAGALLDEMSGERKVSGSAKNSRPATGAACALDGFDFTGIDIDQENIDIAERRIAHWRVKTPAQLAFEFSDV